MSSDPPVKKAQVSSGADLIVEADVGPETTDFRPQQEQSLSQVVETVTSFQPTGDNKSWIIARKKIEQFRPLPWFLWRLSLSIFSKPVGAEEINEGMLLGLRRLLFAAASDPVMGAGGKVNSVKKALTILSPDVVGAVSILHSVCRRMRTFHHESLWRPLFDEALVQAQIGFELGAEAKNIGKGRAMLAGFGGNIGLAIQTAMGDTKHASDALERMSSGESPAKIGLEVYGSEPLQIGAMLLAACGCGHEAAGGVAFAQKKVSEILEAPGLSAVWAAAAHSIEQMRRGKANQLSSEVCGCIGLEMGAREAVAKKAIRVGRSGHSWQWIE